MENPVPASTPKTDNCPCPFGRPYNRIIICSAPIEEPGADEEWYTQDRSAHLVTRQFCAFHCRKAGVPKPVIRKF